jgi:short-subunit dehydrogenase
MVSDVIEKFGQIDFLFNNAGISVTGDFRDLKPEDWTKVLDVNLWGVIHGCAEVVPSMTARRSGYIVNTASLAGLLPFPTNLPYTTSKHAVVGFSLALRAEAADLGVNVSVVCPGFVRTGMFAATPAINAPHEELFRQMPIDSFLDSRKAAHEILAGVTRNRAVIIFPRSADLLWRLYRLWPGSIWWNQLRITRQFRKLRGKE